MKHIYTIIIFILAFSQAYAVSNPADGTKKISLTRLATQNKHVSSVYPTEGMLNRGFTNKNTTTKSSVGALSANSLKSSKTGYDTLTFVGWFKDRCPFCLGAGIGKVTLPILSSCGIGCGTGSAGMADCWSSGLGIYIYNPTDTGKITRDTAISDTHYLLADAQSKELIRAFLLSLPKAASLQISVKVTGYWIKNGITANSDESYIPEISPDSVIHYRDAFHLLSIEGVVIPNQAKSYAGFATNSYKLTPQDLAPSKLSTIFDNTGVTVKFTPPANEGNKKSNLTGYKIRVYNNSGAIQDQFTATSNDTTLRAIKIAGLKAGNNYLYSVSALYPSSAVEVESEQISAVDTFVGWFKDRCPWCIGNGTDTVTLPIEGSCGIMCGTAKSTDGMNGCWNSGLGVFIYNPKETGNISRDSALTDDKHFLLGDAQSKELIRAFLLSIPDIADGKISVKVTGYWIKNGISANSDEEYVPEISSDSTLHYLDAFHYLSIEGTVFPNDTNSFSGFATNSYKLVPQDLAPKVDWIKSITGGTRVEFTPPANEGNVNSNVTSYKARVYSSGGILQDNYTTTKNDTTLRNIDIAGFTATSNYLFTVAALYPSSGVEVESEQSSNLLTGLINNLSLPEVYVYPTYSSGQITVVSPDKAKIKVIDINGSTLEEYQSSGNITINLNVQSGLYFISVESSGKVFVQKVIIKQQ